MKLIIGLGNIGKEYEKTRHNVGFMVLDEYSKSKFEFKLDTKLKANIATINNLGQKAIFIKPTTYMNLSGEAVRNVMNFYKIDIDDILVIYDDMDMPTGKLRIRVKGSAGGHNGIKSIIANLGTQEFKRVKIGIDKAKYDVVDYVLGRFTEDEKASLNIGIDKALEVIDEFIKGTPFDKIMNMYN